MAKRLIPGLAVALVVLSTPVLASSGSADTETVTPTFYGDVLPVLQESCQACHRESGLNMGGLIAPMSFTTYEETRPWAKSIAKAVQSGYMPPWHASDEFHGVFENERTLTDAERETLIAWAKTGATMGDPADAPPAIEWPSSGWAIGEPDLILEMPEEFTVTDETEDQYVNFTVDMPLEQQRWIKAIEFRPGSEVVHHIIGYVVEPGSQYEDGSRGQVGGIAPGNEPDEFPEGFGYPINPGSKFVFAMHYHKEKGPGTAVNDRSIVGIKFYDEGEVPRKMHIEAVGNGRFEIPPNHPNWQVGSARVFDRPIEVHFLMPHMHLRGKAARYVATYPDGTSETLLYVPEYDFNWQTSYKFKEPKVFPAGTRLDVQLWYENTPERAAEANFVNDRPVRWGGPTTDEMDLGWLSFAYLDEAPGSPATATGAGGR